MIGRAGGSIIALEPQRLIAAVHGACAGQRAVVVTHAGSRVPARVAALANGRTILTPYGDVHGVAIGDLVTLDAAGATPVEELDRIPVREPFWTGIRAIDGPLALGRGARIGIFGSPGAGKSTLLEAIVAGNRADATVIGLVGERGREAERWSSRADANTTVICATSDRSAGERLRAAERAFERAAALRARGLHVLLVLDSLARVAAAARDLAIAQGEPVGRGGYPPSVVACQARLLEQAGATRAGSVTLIATVLAEGSIEHDPVADAAKAALDGHIILSARLATAGWFPAIDIPASASRTLAEIAAPAHRTAAARLRAALYALEHSRDARALGLDPAAGDPVLARAVAAEPRLAAFLCQAGGAADPAETLMLMTQIADGL
jgi:FliI/YscN family ATPase